MKSDSRRTFIRNAALAGAACCVPNWGQSAEASKSSFRRLSKGAVILFQGDSITDGNRGRTSDPNHIMGHGYAFSIASRIGADFPEMRYQFYNRGISGNKVIDLEKRWQADAIDLKPDVLSVLVGVNDAASVATGWEPIVTPVQYAEIYERLLVQTRNSFPDVLFVLGEPFIQKGSRTSEHWTDYLNDIRDRQAIVRQLAEKFDAVFLGYQHVFDEANRRAPVDYWVWDGVHPTVAGHELMAREWLRKVEKRVRF